MDVRDLVVWKIEARRALARRRLDLIQAACAPHLSEHELRSLVEDLTRVAYPERWEVLNENAPPTAEQEREWANNRAELLAICGRLQ